MTGKISDVYEALTDIEEQVETVCSNVEVSRSFVWLMIKHRAELNLQLLKENLDNKHTH